MAQSNSPARSQIATSILPPCRKINQKSPSKNEGATPSPGHFGPIPIVLRLIVMFSAILTGRIVRFRQPGRKMKAIPPPLPPKNIADFPSCTPSNRTFPRPSEPTPRRTLVYCHIFEARDRAERLNLSARWQFNDALKPPRRP